MTRHEERAREFRTLAARAREQGLAALLANVRACHERAAARWDELARLNDLFAVGVQARRDALEDARRAALQPSGLA